MSYNPTTDYMNSLGFVSQEKERSDYKVWTNATETRQIRSHRSSTGTWLDFYERSAKNLPWRKLPADPAYPLQADLYRQLVAMGWIG